MQLNVVKDVGFLVPKSQNLLSKWNQEMPIVEMLERAALVMFRVLEEFPGAKIAAKLMSDWLLDWLLGSCLVDVVADWSKPA